ncbi:MAG: elongation factor Ts [bacterium]|nr:elongation factor Ts [bacterium]
MGISAQAVKELRERTGAGMMDCKKALVEVDGDIDEAVKFLRTKGLSAAAKKAHRTASDGMVVVLGGESKMLALELNCETEPVSQLPNFREFGEALANQAFKSGVTTVEELKTQQFTGEPEHTVEEAISLKISLIGENMILSRLAQVEATDGGKLSSYVHMGGKIGVVVEGSDSLTEEVLHDVALHVAANDPKYARRQEVTDDILATEKEIALKQAVEAGKPEHIAEKIVSGKMEKFFEQEVLMEQPFAKDPSISVGEYVRNSGGEKAEVTRFVRFKLGEASAS